MAKKTENSRSGGSLKGKIQLAMTALAFVAALCGFLAFGIVFLFGSSFYAIFLPFVFLAVTIIFFGRWLSNEIVYPVEKVALLAKSYERGVSTTVPKTSGSRETDELVQTIARLGGQVEKLVFSMEEVANGNLNVVLSPAATTDRISQNFQKLLLKVSESIYAKQDLEKLQKAVADISEEITSVKAGNLNAKIKTESPETKEISATLIFLIEQLTEIAGAIKTNGMQARNSAVAAQKTILEIVLSEENRIQEMNQASVKLKQIPDVVQKIFEELSQSSDSGNQSIEKARLGTQAAREILSAVGNMRRQIQETLKRIQNLNVRSQEIGKVAKQTEDLAQRMNLVALNTSMQASDPSETGGGLGFSVISEEIERLSGRAGNVGKQISAINKTFQAEINETENSLLVTAAEAARISKLAIETGSALDEVEKYVVGILNLQNKISSYSGEQINEAHEAFQTFAGGISETENSLSYLKGLATNAAKISDVLEDLQTQVAHFKTSSAIASEKPLPISSYPSPETKFSA